MTCHNKVTYFDPGKLAMHKSKKRKVSDENRTFNASWKDSFPYTADKTGLPVCLICVEKLANHKKSGKFIIYANIPYLYPHPTNPPASLGDRGESGVLGGRHM